MGTGERKVGTSGEWFGGHGALQLKAFLEVRDERRPNPDGAVRGRGFVNWD